MSHLTSSVEVIGGLRLPTAVPFRTKPALAQVMLARALDGGLRPAWVAGDEVYGKNRALRR